MQRIKGSGKTRKRDVTNKRINGIKSEKVSEMENEIVNKMTTQSYKRSIANRQARYISPAYARV